MKNQIALLATVLFLGVTGAERTALAQAPRPPALALGEMKKLVFLAGHWQGNGWMEFAPGQRHKFTSRELVEFKLDGLLLLIEGIHHMKIPGREQEIKIHHAVASVSFDESDRALRMTAHKSDNKSLTATAEVRDGKFIWGFHDPTLGRLRYTIQLNSAGQWFEIGERSPDGKTWTKFFEMTLSKTTEAR